jgi:methylamine dehydrogenase accessory protein MauD
MAMIEALWVSNVVLWICLLALSAVVFALVRQIGVLHERIAPAGALMPGDGPAVGTPAPELHLVSLDDTLVTVGGRSESQTGTLLFFLSPTCPVCKTLLPTLLRVARSEESVPRIVLASDGERAEHQRFVREQGLAGVPYLLSTELGLRYRIGKLPYAVLIDRDGIVRARGIVNTREHLESLFEAERRGVASVQEYLAGHTGAAADGNRDKEEAA